MNRRLLALCLAVLVVIVPMVAGAAPPGLDRLFIKYSRTYFARALDPLVFKAQAIAESGLNPEAVSPVGARGLMQLMPGTSTEVARWLGIEDRPFDPESNVMMGIAYDARLWRSWTAERSPGERLRWVFGSYNAGLGNILKAQGLAKEAGLCDLNRWACLVEFLPKVTGHHAAETIGYVDRIESVYLKLSGQDLAAIGGWVGRLIKGD